MPIDQEARRSLVARTEAIQHRLRSLTSDDRVAGWDDDFAARCIEHLEEGRVCLVMEKRMPRWITHDDMVMYFENPGILDGLLRQQILDITREMAKA